MRSFVNRLSIGRRIGLMTGAILAVFGVALVVAIIGLNGVLDKAQRAEHAARIAVAGEELGSHQLEQRALQAEYVLFKDPALLQQFHASAEAADANRKAIVSAFTDDAVITGAVDRAARADAKHDPTVFDRLAPAVDAGDTAAALAAASDARRLVGDQLKEGVLIRDHLQRTAADAQADAAGAISTARLMLILFMAFALALGVGLSLLLARSIARPVAALAGRMDEIADGDGDLTVRVDESHEDELGTLAKAFNRFVAKVHGVVTQVDHAAQDLSATVAAMARAATTAGLASSEIAATVETVARDSAAQADAAARLGGTARSMTESVTRVAEGASAASDVAGRADASAREGGEVVEVARETMRRIEDRVSDAARVVAGLGEKGQEIGRIVDTITQIADQTNLLALNAAIEAARAGDQGRGFAVVAEEVRQLAEEAQKAAGSIATIIEDIRGETEQAVTAMAAGSSQVVEGVEAVRAAGDAFDTIRGHVAELRDQVDQVAHAVEEMRDGSGEVVDSVAVMASASEANAAAAGQVSTTAGEGSDSVEQVSAASEELAAEAAELAAIVRRFRI